MRTMLVTVVPPTNLVSARSAWICTINDLMQLVGADVDLFIWHAPSQASELPESFSGDKVRIYEMSTLWHVDFIKHATSHYSPGMQWSYLVDLQAIGLLNDAVLVSEHQRQNVMSERFIWVSPSMPKRHLSTFALSVPEISAQRAQWLSAWNGTDQHDQPRSSRAPALISASPSLINRVNATYWHLYDSAIRTGHLPSLPRIYEELAASIPGVISWLDMSSAPGLDATSMPDVMLNTFAIYG